MSCDAGPMRDEQVSLDELHVVIATRQATTATLAERVWELERRLLPGGGWCVAGPQTRRGSRAGPRERKRWQQQYVRRCHAGPTGQVV